MKISNAQISSLAAETPNMPRVLIIDDDIDSCLPLHLCLKRHHYSVQFTLSGTQGIELVKSFCPDLVILNVILAGESGIDTCYAIRMISNVPILMISAVACSERDMIHALDIGADDYLVKPIPNQVLLAKLRALWRRFHMEGPGERHPAYVDPHLIINLEAEQVLVERKAVSLTYTEYRLLEVLVRNAGQYVPTIEIIEELWGEGADNKETSIYSYIKFLRQKIEPDPQDPQYIINKHGYGYRFEPQM